MNVTMRVYISGPYGAPTEAERLANAHRATDAYIALIKKGYVPFCPHLSHWANLRANELGTPVDYEEWLRIDLIWVKQCQILLFLDPSPGADREHTYACELLMPIFPTLEGILKNYGDPYGVFS